MLSLQTEQTHADVISRTRWNLNREGTSKARYPNALRSFGAGCLLFSSRSPPLSGSSAARSRGDPRLAIG